MQNKKRRTLKSSALLLVDAVSAQELALLLFLHLGKALAAVYGAVSLGLKGNLSFLAASCAGCGEELSGAVALLLTSIAASLAALGLVLEAALCVELLLSCCEYELCSAFLAN